MNMMTPRIPKIIFTAVPEPLLVVMGPGLMGPETGTGALTGVLAAALAAAGCPWTAVPHLGQKRTPSPSGAPQLAQHAAMNASLRMRRNFARNLATPQDKSAQQPIACPVLN